MTAIRTLAARLHGAILAALLLGAVPAHAATITIVNGDIGGEGFNDPTPATPVGGNPGTTVGAQRLYVFQYAAGIWGNILPSNVEIRVNAQFNPLSCTATSGVLGSAGPQSYYRDFANAPLAGHWYHVALANKLANADLAVGVHDINAQFNSSIGQAGCLPEGWYYGVDGNEGNQIELLPVVLHELGHGLGFSTPTSGSTGSYFSGYPHAYDHFLYDNVLGLRWDEMTPGQRAVSGVGCTRLTWNGAYAMSNAPGFLNDKPLLRVHSPASIDGDYEVGLATFGPPLSNPGVAGAVVLANDGVGNPSNGCEPFVNAGAIAGKVAMVDRGGCSFTIKVKNAQNAGAIAAIVVDSLPGCPPQGMSGTDPTITIPAVRLTQADGNLIKSNLGSGVSVTLLRDPSLMAGADAAGRIMMYSPSSFSGGSSISHWDVSTDPNLLMEPSLNDDLSSDVDLTRWHFADLGWFQGLAVNVGDRGVDPAPLAGAPNPFRAGGFTTLRFALPRDQVVSLAIYDLAGRRVATLAEGRLRGGAHALRWNGRSSDGREASPGVYLCRLRGEGLDETRHVVLMR